VGIVGAIAGAYIYWEDDNVWVILVGWAIGSSVGVYLVGNVEDETGLFLATLAGSILGTPFLLVGSPISATIGFNMTRRYKSPPIKSTDARIVLPMLSGSF
jgi:hypothetical protein